MVLSPQLLMEEQMVLDLVQEYIEQNRYFKANEIVSFISSRFAKNSTNINVKGIKSILHSLVKKNMIIDGSKLTRETVLSNRNRKRINEYIMQNPGVYFFKIAKALKLNNPVVEWHLNVLLNFQCIRKDKINGQEIYFTTNEDQELDEVIHLVRKEKSKKIIESFLNDNEGITKTRLSKELGMHPKTIKKYIERLEKLGILEKKKTTNKTLYFLQESRRNKLERYLIGRFD